MISLKGKDVLGGAATLFALAVTFNAEYELATAVGIDHIVALAVPGALDVYVLRALQAKRDVFLTVLAMILVNAASHLVTAGVLAVSAPLIIAVSAIAPLVLWRAHVLRHEPMEQPERIQVDDKTYEVHPATLPAVVPVLPAKPPVPAKRRAQRAAVPAVGELTEDDKKHCEPALKLRLHIGELPGVRALKENLGVGTARAQRLRGWLAAQPA